MREILPEYTDEYLTKNLSDPQEGVRLRATQLLRLPAEWRQEAEVAVDELGEIARNGHEKQIDDLDRVRDEVVTILVSNIQA